MPISELCSREVITVRSEDTVLQAAKLMRQHHVGTVMVVEERNGHRVPIGIVTDRDLVVEVLAPELDAAVMTVGDIMVPELASVKDSYGVLDAIKYMRSKGVRRLPVVDGEGGLVGVITLDDLLVLLADELGALARLVEHERSNEASSRR